MPVLSLSIYTSVRNLTLPLGFDFYNVHTCVFVVDIEISIYYLLPDYTNVDFTVTLTFTVIPDDRDDWYGLPQTHIISSLHTF